MAPEGWNRVDCEPLTTGQVHKLLGAVPSETALGMGGVDDDLLRISLAGAQEKTALTRVGSRWCRPHGATPTTHIFKLPLGLVGGSRRVDLSDSVENEWLCAEILRAMGLPVAHTEVAEFAGQKVLIVERFDRAWMDSGQWIARLPQEDFCQALGHAPDQKYERDGGPGMEACLKLLEGSADAEVDRLSLAHAARVLMAASDGPPSTRCSCGGSPYHDAAKDLLSRATGAERADVRVHFPQPADVHFGVVERRVLVPDRLQAA